MTSAFRVVKAGSGETEKMTNTLSSIFTSVTTGFTSAVDGYVGIAVLCIGVLAGLALAAKFLPRKKKVI